MDFLDPRKQRAHRIRLIVGYALIAIAIGLATIILVYGAYGYSVDTKTGDIVQNGLLFVGSKPGGTNIYLDGTSRRTTTPARLVLPAKTYDLTLKKNGYRDWQRSFLLNEHTIARYVYPFLFPAELTAKTLKNYPSTPGFISQSPDQRWLLIQTPGTTPPVVTLDLYDTRNPDQPNTLITLPASLLTNAKASKLSPLEWSADNNHLLLRHTYTDGSEFIILNRSEPARSVNVNKLLKTEPTQVVLRNKKIDQLYIFNQTAATLQVADLANSVIHPPFIKEVLAFKAYGNSLLTYVTNSAQPAGQSAIQIWDNGTVYPLSTLQIGDKYLIDAAQFQGHWYYITGSNVSQRLSIYKDPLNGLKNPAIGKAIPLASLRNPGTTEISFSANTRFIVTQAGQNFAVYDIENQESYHYTLQTPLNEFLRWMDGHRLIGASSNVIQIMDYDGINQQSLLPTILTEGGFFDRNFEHLFTIAPVAGGSTVNLQSIELRAGADLPKQ